MSNRIARVIVIMFVACLSAGCGLVIPNIKEAWDADKPADAAPVTPRDVTGATQIEFEIKKEVYCQLKAAVYAANTIPLKEVLWGVSGSYKLV
jgi:hypothetical protein